MIFRSEELGVRSRGASVCSPAFRRFPALRFLFRTVLCVLSFLLLASSSLAGELLSGRFYTVPEKIYVNQAFEIHFELEVTFGSEVGEMRISGIPNTPDLLTLGQLQTVSQNRIMRDAQAINVLHFVSPSRCFRPIEQTFEPALLCMLSARRTTGFFSQVQSYQKQLKLDPFKLHVRPLPEAGRPAYFSGAIGAFHLNGRLSQTSVQSGDIVTLSLELSGQGWLGDAAMPVPAPSPLFKFYPLKVLLREPLRVQTEQVFIPTATNATEMAALRFSFFNPATERYEESVAGPFRLTFTASSSTPKADDVRVIDTAAPATSDALPQAVNIERMNLTVRQAAPLLVGCAGALAAFFVFFLLYGRHTRLACVCAAALLSAGLGAGYALGGKTAATSRALARHTEVRFAPSRSATTLFALNPGAAVTPLESAGAWVRIDTSGRRGWIPAASLAEPAAGPQ